MFLREGDGIVLSPTAQQQTQQTRGVIAEIVPADPHLGLGVTYRIEVQIGPYTLFYFTDGDYRRIGEGDPIGSTAVWGGFLPEEQLNSPNPPDWGPVWAGPRPPIGVKYRD